MRTWTYEDGARRLVAAAIGPTPAVYPGTFLEIERGSLDVRLVIGDFDTLAAELEEAGQPGGGLARIVWRAYDPEPCLAFRDTYHPEDNPWPDRTAPDEACPVALYAMDDDRLRELRGQRTDPMDAARKQLERQQAWLRTAVYEVSYDRRVPGTEHHWTTERQVAVTGIIGRNRLVREATGHDPDALTFWASAHDDD